MKRVLFVIYAMAITAVVTAVNYGEYRSGGGGSYRSWSSSGSGYSGGGGWHK